MIDIHCHILDGIDDGPKDIKDSLKMAIRAKQLGYSGVCATSHYIDIDLENDKNIIIKKVIELKTALRKNNIDLDIYIGNEVYFSSNIVSLLKTGKISTLANSKYFLMELPMIGFPLNTFEVIGQIIEEGYTPILAHPERYECVKKDFSIIEKLVSMGVLLQVNIASIKGIYGKEETKLAIKLLKRNMVNLLATDSHDFKTIYNEYSDSIYKISKILPLSRLRTILEVNPYTIINNRNIY